MGSETVLLTHNIDFIIVEIHHEDPAKRPEQWQGRNIDDNEYANEGEGKVSHLNTDNLGYNY